MRGIQRRGSRCAGFPSNAFLTKALRRRQPFYIHTNQSKNLFHCEDHSFPGHFFLHSFFKGCHSPDNGIERIDTCFVTGFGSILDTSRINEKCQSQTACGTYSFILALIFTGRLLSFSSKMEEALPVTFLHFRWPNSFFACHRQIPLPTVSTKDLAPYLSFLSIDTASFLLHIFSAPGS